MPYLVSFHMLWFKKKLKLHIDTVIIVSKKHWYNYLSIYSKKSEDKDFIRNEYILLV